MIKYIIIILLLVLILYFNKMHNKKYNEKFTAEGLNNLLSLYINTNTNGIKLNNVDISGNLNITKINNTLLSDLFNIDGSGNFTKDYLSMNIFGFLKIKSDLVDIKNNSNYLNAGAWVSIFDDKVLDSSLNDSNKANYVRDSDSNKFSSYGGNLYYDDYNKKITGFNPKKTYKIYCSISIVYVAPYVGGHPLANAIIYGKITSTNASSEIRELAWNQCGYHTSASGSTPYNTLLQINMITFAKNLSEDDTIDILIGNPAILYLNYIGSNCNVALSIEEI